MLTHRQRDALVAIIRHIDANGRSPSVRELAQAIGYGRHVAHTAVLLDGLEARGFIRRHNRGMAPMRCEIEVLRPIPIAEIYRFNDATKELEPLP